MALRGDGVRLVVYPLKLTEMYHVSLVNTCCQSMEFSVSYVQADRPTGTSVQLWIGSVEPCFEFKFCGTGIMSYIFTVLSLLIH